MPNGTCAESALLNTEFRTFYEGISKTVISRYQNAIAIMRQYKAEKEADHSLTPERFHATLSVNWAKDIKLLPSISTVRNWVNKTDHGRNLSSLIPKKTGPKKSRKMTDELKEIFFNLMVSCYPTQAAKKVTKKPEAGSIHNSFKAECMSRKMGESAIPGKRTLQRDWKSRPSHEKEACMLSAKDFNSKFYARGTNDWRSRAYTIQLDHEVLDYMLFKDADGEFKVSICVCVEPAFGCIITAMPFEGSMDGDKLDYAFMSMLRFDEGYCPGFYHIPALWMVDNESPHKTETIKKKAANLGIENPDALKGTPRHRGGVERAHFQIQRRPLREFENYVRQEVTRGKYVVANRNRKQVLVLLQQVMRAFIYENNSAIPEGETKSRLELWREKYSLAHQVRKEDVIPYAGIRHNVAGCKMQQVYVKPLHHKRMLLTNDHIKPGIGYLVIELPSQHPQFFVFDYSGVCLGEAKHELAGSLERRKTELHNHREHKRIREKVEKGRSAAAKYFKDRIDKAPLAPEEAVPLIPAPRKRKSARETVATKVIPIPLMPPEPDPHVSCFRSFDIPDMGVCSKIAVPV